MGNRPAARAATRRRRLPRRVYWVRRALVLGVVALVVVGLVVGARGLLGGSTGGPQRATTAAATVETSGSPSAGAQPSPTAGTTTDPGTDPTTGPAVPGTGPGAEPGTPTPRSSRRAAAAVRPDGVCPGADVVVTPAITGAHARGDVTVELQLTTQRTPACTWQLGPDRVFVKIGSTTQALWASQQCPAAIPLRELVLRRDRPVTVAFTWDGRQSDAGCNGESDWVEPGVYTATAMAQGSVTRVDAPFRLLAPVRPARPAPSASPSARPGPSSEPPARPKPSASPSPRAGG